VARLGGDALSQPGVESKRRFDSRDFLHYLPERPKLLGAGPTSRAACEMLFHIAALDWIGSLVQICDQTL
jgi:hypothetical protein